MTHGEKRNFEELLQMGGGYVLDFSNRTFQEFVFDSTGLDIDAEAVGGSGSRRTAFGTSGQISRTKSSASC
jgi:hypothetical protein